VLKFDPVVGYSVVVSRSTTSYAADLVQENLVDSD
jgi:hypothetical protein